MDAALRKTDPLVGRQVVIRSMAGIDYRGCVRSIGYDEGFGELFELGSRTDGSYRRLVHVVDRLVQIRDLDEPEP